MSNFIYHEPRYKVVMNKYAQHKVMSIVGDVALMCPNCLHMIETNVGYTTKVINNVLDKIEDFHIDNEYYGVCPCCNDDVKFELIDANMAEIINILNTKGYYTIFCCEGHIEPDDFDGEECFTVPYIYFYFWEDTKVFYTNPLPNTWYIDDVNKKYRVFSIRDHIIEEVPGSIIKNGEIIDNIAFIGWLKNHWDQKKRLEDIYNWAVSLPEKSAELKRKHMDIIIRNKEGIILNNAYKINSKTK